MKLISVRLLWIAVLLIFTGGITDIIMSFTATGIPESHVKFMQLQRTDIPLHFIVLDKAMLRAIGGCLVAIALGGAAMLSAFAKTGNRNLFFALVIMIVVSEGNNTIQMLRVESPFYFYTAGIVFIALLSLLSWYIETKRRT